jgi:hypothetical protein
MPPILQANLRWFADPRYGHLAHVLSTPQPPVPHRRIASVVSTLREQQPLFDSHRTVHSQKADCDPARRCHAEDFPLAKLIVLVPAIQAWVEQARELPGFEICRGDIDL